MPTEEQTEARRVVEELAAERGYTLEELAEQIAARGWHEEEALTFLEDGAESDAVFLVLVDEILCLSREDLHRYQDAIMTDVAASFGRPWPPPRWSA